MDLQYGAAFLCLKKNLFHKADSEGPSAHADRTSLGKWFSVFLWFHSHCLLIFRGWLLEMRHVASQNLDNMFCNTLKSAVLSGNKDFSENPPEELLGFEDVSLGI